VDKILNLHSALQSTIDTQAHRIAELERALFRLHSNAAESEHWIRRQVETVLRVEHGFQKGNKS
jgi:hypothetical protein